MNKPPLGIVREKVIEANPSAYEFGVPKEIGLADVLLAINKIMTRDGSILMVASNGNIWRGNILRHTYQNTGIGWDLSFPFEGQNPITIAFLAELLKDNK